MCGWHNKRFDGASLRVALLGALFGLILPPLGGWAELRAADEESEDDTSEQESGKESEQESDEASRSVSTSLEVIGYVRSPTEDAARQPESAFTVLVDDSIPPTAIVADALLRVPGATVRRSGGPLDSSFVNIRGSSARQVSVFVDGVPLNNFGASAVDLSELPLQAFDRIDVYRGYAPAHLGSFAIGGAIDLITDPARLPPPKVQVSYGSWQTRRVSLSAATPLPVRNGVGQIRAHVGYHGTRGNYRAFSNNGTLYSEADDSITPRGNNHRDQLTGLLNVSARVGVAELRLLDLAGWSDGGQPGAYYAQSQQARSRSIQNLLHGRAALRLHPTVTLSGGLGWRVRSDLYQDLLGEVGVGNQDQRNHVHTIDGDVSAALDPTPWLRVRPSVRGNLILHRGIENLPSPQRTPLHRRIGGEFAVDAQLRPLGDRLHVRASLGALVLQDGSSEVAKPNLFAAIFPGAAIAVHPVPELTLRASVSRGARAPTYTELFGDRGSIVGNPNLLPESSTQVDGGFSLALGRTGPVVGSVEVEGFVREVRDLIVLVPNSARVGVPQNITRARLAGIESNGAISVADMFVGRLAVTANLGSEILDGESGVVGNRVPHVPAWQVSASLALVLRHFLRVQWSFVGLGGTFDSPSNFFEQSTRPLHDLHLRVQPDLRFPWVALDLRNVFDTFIGSSFRNPLNPSPDDVAPVPLQDFRGQPLPGRSFMVTVGWSPARPSPGHSR